MRKKNLRALKQYYPQEYYKLSNKTKNKYELVDSKIGYKNLNVGNNLTIHSRYNPELESKRWTENIFPIKEDTLILFGTGLGYCIKYLMKFTIDKKIIIIEPDIDIFESALSVTDYTEALRNENIVFFVGLDMWSIENIISSYLFSNKISSFKIVEMPIYKRIYSQYLEELYYSIKKSVSKIRANLATEQHFSKMWLENTLKNLVDINNYYHIYNLGDAFQNIPVIIVSAGPSLEKNLYLLKGLYNKALIIAVGSAINVLEKYDIQPHIIMGVDGNVSEANIFKNLNNYKPLLLYAHSIHYKSLEYYKGRKACFIIQEEKGVASIFENSGINTEIIACGPSVANVALGFAWWLKSGPIMLIGQDLAYTDNKLYSSGVVHSKKDIEPFNNENVRCSAVDIYGNKVETKDAFLAMRDWFADFCEIRSIQNKVFNCTEGGLPIKGILNMKFSNAIEQYCHKNYDIEKRLDGISSNEKLNITSIIKLYSDEAIEINKWSERRIELLKGLIKSDDFTQKTFDKVLLYTKKIEATKLYDNFIGLVGRRYVQALRSAYQNKANKKTDIIKKRKIILEGLLKEYEYINESIIISKEVLYEEKIIENN